MEAVSIHDSYAMNSGSTKQHNFSPYADNGGSLVAIAGDDYAVLACDTRLTTGYSIYTRKQTKLFKLTEKTVLGCTGCWCDVLTFVRLMEAKLKMYSYEHNKTMSTAAVAQLASIMLYHKRFFPYFAWNLAAGLNEKGEGVVYTYDPVGHYEETKFASAGSSSALLQPLLDNQVGRKNIADEELKKKKLSLEEAVKLISDAFISATERNIYCGDAIDISIITKDGVEKREIPLRRD